MPELPEVETVVRTLRPMLDGGRLERVIHVRADMVSPPSADLGATIRGHEVTRIDRRGKRILIRLDDGRTLLIHLGMTGRLTIEPADSALRSHTHLIVEVLSLRRSVAPSLRRLQLRFVDPRRFGEITLLDPGDDGDSGLGPDALTLRPSTLRRLLADRHRPIKSALLDQTLIAGLGNIYADESLFASGIHPLTHASELGPGQVQRLCRSIKLVLRRALRLGGSSLRDYVDANGNTGFAQRMHRVYDRAGLPCHSCNCKIERLVLSGRSTCFCPKCQMRGASHK